MPEPQVVGTTTRRPGQREGLARLDAVTYLTVFLVAALAIESRMVVGPLGGAGNPAQLLAMGGLAWWLFFHVQRATPSGWGRQPVRLALLGLFLAFTASYAGAMSRPIDGIEASSATLGMVSVLGWLGVALLAHDGVSDRARLDTLVRRLVLGSAAVAVLGVAQFVLHDALIRWIEIPGLRPNLPLMGLQTRSGFTRPSGTALHPIEFGAVLTTTLPLAIGWLRTTSVGARLLPGACVFSIGLGVVVSGSRSAILCALVGLVVLAATWSARSRLVAGVGVASMLVFVVVAMPGVTGSFVSLFTGITEDGSVKSRTDSYAIVVEFFGRQPWTGRGFSTFLPSYRILDNQYLLLLVEVGVIGLVAFLGVLGTAFACARAARRRALGGPQAELAQSVAAAIAAATIGLGTYDGLSFPTATAILFLVVGVAGATRRLDGSPP